MPLEPKAQLVDPQGPIDVTGVNATGVTTATGGFVGNIQGSATGLASTTLNLTAGIITATRFIGDVTGTASSLNRGANITVGMMTATFVGDLLGNATGLTTTTSNLNLGIVTSTGFRGNFTGLSSGLSGTPNIQTGITTATKFIGNSTGTVVDLADDTNINVGIITATKFEGNTTGSVTDLADDTNINVGIITASKFIGNANGSVTGLADDTNINVATFTGTQFIGNSPGTAADLKSGTNLTVGTFTGTKFIGNTPGSATKLADDVNVAASTFTGTKFVGNTPGTVSDIADDTNLNLGTLTGTKFEGNTTGSVSAISDDTNLNLGTLTASQFIGNTPGNAAGISAAQNIAGGTITATTFYGDGSNITGAASPAFAKQDVTAQSGTTTINLNSGNIIYLTHSNDTTIAFSNVTTSSRVTIIRTTTTSNTITWPSGVYWDGGSAPAMINNDRVAAGQVFQLNTSNGGTNWYAYEIVDSDPQTFGLFAWGENSKGQLGQNTVVSHSSPVQIPGATWIKLSDGMSMRSSSAIKTDGTLWTWGENSQGQLGHNNKTKYSSPVQIPGTTWSHISQGGDNSKNAIAIKSDGTMWSWGENEKGNLGQNNKSDYSSPKQIPGTDWDYCNSAGNDAQLAIKNKDAEGGGEMFAWGSNNYGQLGTNNKTEYSSPKSIGGPSSWVFAKVGRPGNSIGIKKDGGSSAGLWTWGLKANGALGQNEANWDSPAQSPVRVGSAADWAWDHPLRIAVKMYGAFAIKTNGTLYAWGSNSNGILGQNNTTAYSSPIQIPGTNWYAISATNNIAVGLKEDGTLWSWGYNGQGALGQNSVVKYSSPVQVPGSWKIGTSMDATTVKAGWYDSAGIKGV